MLLIQHMGHFIGWLSFLVLFNVEPACGGNYTKPPVSVYVVPMLPIHCMVLQCTHPPACLQQPSQEIPLIRGATVFLNLYLSRQTTCLCLCEAVLFLHFCST